MVIAEQVMGELGLDHILFVPAGVPPHKEASSVRASTGRPLRHGRGRRGGQRAVLRGQGRGRRRAPHAQRRDCSDPQRAIPGRRVVLHHGADEVSNLLAWKDPDRLLEEVDGGGDTDPATTFRGWITEAKLRNFDRSSRGVRESTSRRPASGAGSCRARAYGTWCREEVYEIIMERGLYKGDEKRSGQGGRLKEETR